MAGKAHPVQKSAQGGRGKTRDKVAKIAGVSHDTLMRKRIVNGFADFCGTHERRYMRNNEHYIDPTAQAAIKRAHRPGKKPRPWGDRLTYTVGEVMKGILRK
ncbi:hypothetical protein [Anaerocolumna xylanovorans]|uniref:Uncharacterized protein n=1 Tax=Anaerocolumna xylanovorans DSM 12503 TaxID=1121345 RepID=A0A1M7Y3J7_9FIRM|nr:hypothetical protein [Anaerocolumna xylanovorans]SHO46772.1 hypothetical protein SAMN02745217_01283 [Anaerocolumna xylanovorans DSM 12503]